MQMLRQLAVFLVATGILTSCGAGHNSNPQGSSKAYQAVYQVPRGNLFSEERIWADGHGHFRMDVDGAGPLLPKIVTVWDMSSNETTVWSEGENARKAYARGPSPPINVLKMMVAPDSYPRGNDIQLLGNKTIDGHKCHGWGNSSGTESWIDDEYGCIVQGTASSGSEPMKMTSFSTSAPDPSLFMPPSEYVSAQTTSNRTD